MPELSRRDSLRLRPHARRFVGAEKFDLDDVRVAADGAVFDVALLAAAGGVQRDDDPLAAGGADVGAFVGGAGALGLAALHAVGKAGRWLHCRGCDSGSSWRWRMWVLRSETTAPHMGH